MEELEIHCHLQADFNKDIVLQDLFLEDENNYFEKYADDTTSYSVGSTTTEVLENLSGITKNSLHGLLTIK